MSAICGVAFTPGLAPCLASTQSSTFLRRTLIRRPSKHALRAARRATVVARAEQSPNQGNLFDDVKLTDLKLENSAENGTVPENGAVSENGVVVDATAESASVLKIAESDASSLRTLYPGEEKASMGNDATGRTDLSRVGAVAVLVSLTAALLQHDWVIDHRDLTMEMVFIIGYLGITLEEIISYDKTGVALLMGVGVWTVLDVCAGANSMSNPGVNHLLSEQLADISQILFFLIGAMTIVEIVDAHRGFKVVTDFITTNNRRVLMWTIGVLTFFTSAVLDNLTATIVVVSLLRKLVKKTEERWLYGAVAVVAANAGGAWTPIGDVTTTQLWLHGNISALATMKDLFIPSLVSMITTVALIAPSVEGDFERPEGGTGELAPRARLVFWTGLAALISVPIFKAVTGLPPYLGMLSGLGTLWVMTDAIHAGEDRESLRGMAAVKRIDTSSVLFFLGILLAVGGLESAGILEHLAVFLDQHISNRDIIAALVGLFSSIVDNVPLVAATMGMYSLEEVRPDSQLWQLVAFCAGTGGSILIIGSAAGVAFMGMERVEFGWYARKMSIPTLVGFFAGIGTYLLGNYVHFPNFLALAGQ